MTVMFAEDFMGYGYDSQLMLNGLWGTMPNGYFIIVDDIDPNSPAGTKVMKVTNNPLGARRPFREGSLSVVGVAFRLWLSTLPTQTGILCATQSADNTYRLLIAIDPVGKILVYNSRPLVAPIGGTDVPVLTANAYHHIETKFTLGAGATAAIEIRVDGVTVLTLAGLTSNAPTAEQIIISNGEGSFQPCYFKDLVVWNNLGTHNTDFLGTVSVLSMVPNSDATLTWTPSVGVDGFSILDNSPPLDGTDYLTAPYPPPAPSVFGLSNLPINVTSVRALITQVRARTVDGGDGNLQTSLISSGNTVNGSDRPTTTAFTYYEDVFETDPHTAAAWTPAAADAAQLQLNRTV